MKKCIVIYNPVSGKKEFESKVSYVKERLIEAGYDVTIKATEKSKHAIKLAKEACEMKYDLMVVSGGDGTIHEIINGISKMEYKPIIGYIPSGTACDLANTLRISKDVDKALDVILNGEVVEMDVVNSNKGYFVYVTAIGTYVDISYVTDSKMKKHLGYLAYIITGIKEFFTIPMMKSRIEHDGGELKGYFSLMMVVNSKRVAGFNIIDKPQLDDGMVDVVLYRYIPFFNNILYFISFILTPKVIPGVRKIRTSSLKIFTDHHHKWNMDGEEANSGNLKLTVEKKAIKILVNPKISKKYFKESYYGKKEN